jgi:hypothetical protein
MKKNTVSDVTDNVDEMLPEYDFSGGVRGKYAERYARSVNIVLLDPDVAEVFPDSDAVNRALRLLAASMREQQTGTADSCD